MIIALILGAELYLMVHILGVLKSEKGGIVINQNSLVEKSKMVRSEESVSCEGSCVYKPRNGNVYACLHGVRTEV